MAISSHKNYWIWGPGTKTGDVLIIIWGDCRDCGDLFDEWEQVATHTNEYARSFETDFPIFLCRGLRTPINEIWPGIRHFE